MDSIKNTIANSPWPEKNHTSKAIGYSPIDNSGEPVENKPPGNRFNLPIPEADDLIAKVSDLIADHKYDPFYYKHLYRLGPGKFLELAERARGGKNPAGLFSKLLKYS
jgi:hypothetical protein